MQVGRSAYYDWLRKPAKLITVQELDLYREAKRLFTASRGSLGARQLMKNLRESGFDIGLYRTKKLMKKLNLVCIQRRQRVITSVRKHSDAVADNLLNQEFNPVAANQYWAGDITYLRTHQGWMYLAVVMDLHSRKIIGWHMDKQMTVSLVKSALKMALNLRGRHKNLIFHSDRGCQYTSQEFRRYLKDNHIRASMSGKAACLDNAVVERFFGSLKHEWLLKVSHLTRESMRKDVEDYIRYYNLERLHTSLGDMTPVEYEYSKGILCGNS